MIRVYLQCFLMDGPDARLSTDSDTVSTWVPAVVLGKNFIALKSVGSITVHSVDRLVVWTKEECSFYHKDGTSSGKFLSFHEKVKVRSSLQMHGWELGQEFPAATLELIGALVVQKELDFMPTPPNVEVDTPTPPTEFVNCMSIPEVNPDPLSLLQALGMLDSLPKKPTYSWVIKHNTFTRYSNAV